MAKDNYWSARKFIDDTLKEADGKWSMKRICIAIAFPYVLGLGIYIVLSDRILIEKVVNPFAMQVFDSVWIFIGVGLGMTVWANIKKESTPTQTDICPNCGNSNQPLIE